MIAFGSPAPRLPLAVQFARLESYLPCARCSTPGPHRTYPARAGGTLAVCGDCRRLIKAEARQYSIEDGIDSLHGAPLAREA